MLIYEFNSSSKRHLGFAIVDGFMSVNLFNISITLIYFFTQQDKENFTVTLTALLTGQSFTILCLKHEVIPMKCRLCNNTQRKTILSTESHYN